METRAGLTLKARLYLMLGCMILGLLVFGAYSTVKLRQHILEEKKAAVAALVDSALGVVQQQYDLFKAGQLTEDEAKRLAKDNLRKSRYNDGADYFFIYDFDGINLMHGSKPEREGKSFLDSTDPNGKPYIKEWIDLLKRDRGAYIDYMFPKAGSTQPLAKVSYAKVFEPWGWWLGTGVYIEDVDEAFRDAAIELTGFLIVIGLLLGVLGISINRSVHGLIGGEPAEVAVQVDRFAGGDLTQTMTSDSSRPGNLMSALATMQARLRDIVRNILGNTEDLAREAANLAVAANEISLAARNQAESSAATAAAIEELTVSINEVSEIARATEDNSRLTVDLAGKGTDVVRQATDEIENIAVSVQDSTDRIQSLVGRSQEVGNITSVIREIADQTNLLALNAAIEAARAGEQGRGFAVVADEVRKLAERTSSATAEISQMVSAIQDDTQHAVQAMEGTMPRVKAGQDLAQQASTVLSDIQRQAGDSLTRAREVASATQAQAATANDIAGHVETIATMTEQTNAATQSNAEAAGQLKELADKLRADVAYFQV